MVTPKEGGSAPTPSLCVPTIVKPDPVLSPGDPEENQTAGTARGAPIAPGARGGGDKVLGPSGGSWPMRPLS